MLGKFTSKPPDSALVAQNGAVGHSNLEMAKVLKTPELLSLCPGTSQRQMRCLFNQPESTLVDVLLDIWHLHSAIEYLFSFYSQALLMTIGSACRSQPT